MQILMTVLLAMGLGAILLPLTPLRAEETNPNAAQAADRQPSSPDAPTDHLSALPAGADAVLTPEKKKEINNVVDKYKGYRDSQQKALDAATEGN